jgi:IclR family mhp operon transcriptional activator
MTIRYTTRPTAPISISDPINTAGLPMLESDFGRAFLAFASSEQQARILAALARSERKLDAAARDAELTRRLLDGIRRQGFATRGESFTFTRAATIAVAVTVAGQSVGAVNVICSTRFMDPADIPKRYLPPVRQAAAEIGGALSWDGFVVTVRRRGA